MTIGPGGATAVQVLVDRLLDRADQAHPGVEYSLTMTRENTLLLPMHHDKIVRVVDDRIGTYSGHAYRDVLVDAMPVKDWLVMASPVGAATPTYFGDLRTGQVSMTPPRDAFF